MGFYTEIASATLKLIFAILSVVIGSLVIPWIRSTAIPWLKEKRLYNVVQKFVLAAEKLGETGAIDRSKKKDYVVKLLIKKGYIVDAEVEAFIESAVKEMDMFIESGVTEITNEFEIGDELCVEDGDE
ncbi:MAG: hypothetical protein IJ418_16105 [Clostridia bacterium]|nr:hypothetical protein [Clostridia bacterium]